MTYGKTRGDLHVQLLSVAALAGLATNYDPVPNSLSEAWITLRRNRHWCCRHHHLMLTQLQCKLSDVNGATMGIAEVIESDLQALMLKAILNIGFVYAPIGNSGSPRIPPC